LQRCAAAHSHRSMQRQLLCTALASPRDRAKPSVRPPASPRVRAGSCARPTFVSYRPPWESAVGSVQRVQCHRRRVRHACHAARTHASHAGGVGAARRGEPRIPRRAGTLLWSTPSTSACTACSVSSVHGVRRSDQTDVVGKPEELGGLLRLIHAVWCCAKMPRLRLYTEAERPF
jgi:hypothetical protein